MEFEDVSEKVEWEARRVAAAFGVEEWEQVSAASEAEGKYLRYRGEDIEWQIDIMDGDVFSIEAGDAQENYCHLFNYPDYWVIDPSDAQQNERMMRGLYRLGIEDADVLAELNHSLTSHEKLELRLSLPGEFWPKTWIEEEGEV